MTDSTMSAEGQSAPSFSHEEFRTGLPFGRFHVIMNPLLAHKYVRHRLFVVFLSLPIVALGVAFSIYGFVLIGLPLIILGVMLNRIVKANAPRIMLFLAARYPEIYHDAIEYEIMEVQLARMS